MVTDERRSHSARLAAEEMLLLRRLRRETAYADEVARYAGGELGSGVDPELAAWQDLQAAAVVDIDD